MARPEKHHHDHQSTTTSFMKEDIVSNNSTSAPRDHTAAPSQDNYNNPTPPTLLAHLLIPSTFLIWFNTWGAINAFGVFQTHYKLHLLSSSTPSAIAWIGSVQNWLILFIGFFSGPLYDAGYTPALVSFGAGLNVLGMMMTSLVRDEGEYWQVFLAQGVCVGLGWGLMFTPAASMLGRFWDGRRVGVVTGLASAGASVGGVIISVTFNQLLQNSGVGFAWATRCLGFIAFGTLTFSCVVMGVASRRRQFRASRRKLVDRTAFKEFRFNTYLVAGIFTMAGIQAPYCYANLYAIDKGMTSTAVGFYVITAINTGSFFGRLTPPFVAMRLGVFNTFILCYVGTFVSCFAFMAVRSAGGIFMVAILYGFFSGAVVTLSPITIIQMTPDPKLIGTRMGMAFAIPSFGVLVGCPIFGEILSATGNYTYIWALSGLSIATGAAFMVMCRIAQSGGVLLKKV